MNHYLSHRLQIFPSTFTGMQPIKTLLFYAENIQLQPEKAIFQQLINFFEPALFVRVETA